MATAPTATKRSNILHEYSNYTYNLQLWAITKGDFNKISKGSIVVGKESDIISSGELLISNGGVGNGEKRSSSFPTDFVIDNLEIESVVGNKGSGARGTDALSLKFDIIEPYTVTLLNRLVNLTQSSKFADKKDFKTLIYCLKITFLGYDDLGRPKADSALSKWIPFSLLNIAFNITHKGAVYNCQGIALQNFALTNLDNVIPFHVELKGSTVQEIFNGTKFSTSSAGSARSDGATTPNNNSTTVTKGIAEALNENEQYRFEQRAITYKNEYKFEFEDELLNSKVTLPNTPISNLPMPNVTPDNVQRGALGVLSLDTVNNTFRSAPGTKITDFIQSVMMTTEFMKNQVISGGGQGDKPFTGIKIIPKLELKEYDPKTNWFSRVVTYVVKTYEYYGTDHEKVNKKQYPNSAIVKDYEYIFTGNNKDVIKASLDYKVAFFDPRNSVKRNTVESSGEIADPDDYLESNVNPQQAASLGRPGRNSQAGLPAATQGSATYDPKSLTLAEQVSQLFDNGVDLISLDIEIVGDPDWIQQDNILYGPNVPKNQKTLSNGTITFQDSVTCFQFTFKSPTRDYDDTTGLMLLDSAETASFSGVYQVLTVSNRFQKGKFTQLLRNVRLRNQQEPQQNTNNAAATTTRTTTSTVSTRAPTQRSIDGR